MNFTITIVVYQMEMFEWFLSNLQYFMHLFVHFVYKMFVFEVDRINEIVVVEFKYL